MQDEEQPDLGAATLEPFTVLADGDRDVLIAFRATSTSVIWVRLPAGGKPERLMVCLDDGEGIPLQFGAADEVICLPLRDLEHQLSLGGTGPFELNLVSCDKEGRRFSTPVLQVSPSFACRRCTFVTESAASIEDHILAEHVAELRTLENDYSRIRDAFLLTNFSMLEYLLIRPYDSPLFDKGLAKHWAFIVIDEAHQYRGAKGIEMAMLIRRLKQRLRAGGRSEPIRCVATSATLGGGEADRSAIAEFASNLFGQPFTGDNVILPKTRQVSLSPERTLKVEDYVDLERSVLAGSMSAEELGRTLAADQRAADFVRRIRAGPILVESLAVESFESEKSDVAYAATSALIRLLTIAHGSDGEPLLSTRIHLFLRSLEGAFASFSPSLSVSLSRSASPAASSFELALCRECGQHYLAGRRAGRPARLTEAIRDPSDPDSSVTFYRPVEAEIDHADADIDDGYASTNRIFVCGICAVVADTLEDLGRLCEHNSPLALEEQESSTKKDRAKRCSACGYSGQDPIAEIVHGTDGPHAVVATTLYQGLEPGHRKALAFADGRQQAAFFAWYLDSSYRDLHSRNLIYASIRGLGSAEGPASLSELALDLELRSATSGGLPESMGRQERRRQAWRGVYRELLADQRRLSLEGLGLVDWSIEWPRDFAPPRVLMEAPWSCTREEALDVVLALLDTLRQRRAVAVDTGEALSLDWTDLDLSTPRTSVRIGPPDGQARVIAWDGDKTQRADFLRRLLRLRPPSSTPSNDGVVSCLRQVWDQIRLFDEGREPSEALLIPSRDGFRLNLAWWRASVPGHVGVCNTCRRIHTRWTNGVCLRFRCEGLVELDDQSHLEDSHYRKLAERLFPGPLRVEEHTAQLSNQQASTFQRDFKNGRIGVLSCSTTFELGVDLGDLDAVFLRNVPPEAFNYAQRVGRAGRRPGRPGFAITYCSRAAHDLYYFAEPSAF